jgi:hypothetical protein
MKREKPRPCTDTAADLQPTDTSPELVELDRRARGEQP